MSYLLGMDIGTYSSSATVIDVGGTRIAEASVEHDLSVPRSGWAEHDSETVWWHDVKQLCRTIVESHGVNPGQIKGLSISAIAPCVLPVDRFGKPLRPAILYGVDTRSHAEIDELTELLGREWLLEHAGCDLSTQSAGPKIRWLRKHEPEIWRETERILTSTSYLCYKLTGKVVIDHYTAAFFAPLYDLKSLSWSGAASIEVCGPELLPELRWTSEEAGRITAGAARDTGLREGTPVMVGTADAAADALSAGVSRAGEVMIMHGSSLFLIAISDTLPQGGTFWAAPFLFPGTFALAGGMATTGALTQWFRRNFTRELGHEPSASRHGPTTEETFARLAEEADVIPPGSEGLIALPYFSGERTPINDPHARGVLAGLTLHHGRGHVYRALLEGVAYGVRHNLEEIEAMGMPIRSLTAVGGGTHNATWMQIVSDVTERPHQLRSSSGASIGDALIAGLGIGAIRDNEEIRSFSSTARTVEPRRSVAEVYRRGYILYRELYEKSKLTVHALYELSEMEAELS